MASRTSTRSGFTSEAKERPVSVSVHGYADTDDCNMVSFAIPEDSAVSSASNMASKASLQSHAESTNNLQTTTDPKTAHHSFSVHRNYIASSPSLNGNRRFTLSKSQPNLYSSKATIGLAPFSIKEPDEPSTTESHTHIESKDTTGSHSHLESGHEKLHTLQKVDKHIWFSTPQLIQATTDDIHEKFQSTELTIAQIEKEHPFDNVMKKAIERRATRIKFLESNMSLNSKTEEEEENLGDDALFPGYKFYDGGVCLDSPPLSAFVAQNNSITATSKQNSIVQPNLNHDVIPIRVKIPLDHIDESNIDGKLLLETCMTPGSVNIFEQQVLTKHRQNGIFTNFKGKDDMKIEHSKVVAKREIRQVKEAIDEKEKELLRLNQDLIECQSHQSQALYNCETLISNLQKLIDSSPKSTNPFTIPVPQLSTTSSSETEPVLNKQTPQPLQDFEYQLLNFQFPIDPILTQNRTYRQLRDAYLEQVEIVKSTMRAIPDIESAIIPVQHDLAMLQVQETRYEPLEEMLLEAQIKDSIEAAVVDKLLKEDRKKKEKMKLKAEIQRDIQAQEEQEEQWRKQKEHKLMLKNNHAKMKLRLEKTILDVRKEEARKLKQLENMAIRKKTALKNLDSHIIKIRNRLLKKTPPSENNAEDANNMRDDGFDLSEAPSVRETRLRILKMKEKEEQDRERARELAEERRMNILNKLIKEETVRRVKLKEEAKRREIHHILENLSPKGNEAFPVIEKPGVLNLISQTQRKKPSKGTSKEQVVDSHASSSIHAEVAEIPILIESDNINENINTLSPKDENIENESVIHDSTQKSKPDSAKSLTSQKSKPTDLIPNEEATSSEPRQPLPAPRHKIITQPTDDKSHEKFVSFTSNPHEVIFTDYDPESIYTKKVKMTNTSGRVNTFKLLPVPVDLASYFEVHVPPPGHLSAGMECEITVTFRPPSGYDRDIKHGRISFHAEHGGKFDIKVGCLARKCIPRISKISGKGILSQSLIGNESRGRRDGKKVNRKTSDILNAERSKVKIDFGPCVPGDNITRIIEIMNEGALPTDYEVKSCEIVNQNPSTEPNDGEQSNSRANSAGKEFRVTKNKKGTLKGYSKKSIQVTFHPKYDSATSILDSKKLIEPTSEFPSRFSYFINFNSPNISPIQIDCTGSIIECPIGIEKDLVDFNVCITDYWYKEKVTLHNRSNIAYKFWIEFSGMTEYEHGGGTFDPTRANNMDEDAESTISSNTWGSNIASDGMGNGAGEDFMRDSFLLLSDPDLNNSNEYDNSKDNSRSQLSIAFEDWTKQSNSLLNETATLEGTEKRTLSIIKKPKAIRNKRSDSLNAAIPEIGELEISPRLAFIQPYESFSFWVKIKPSRAAHILLEDGQSSFEFPIIVKYMNQRIETPIPIKLAGQVTTTDINFELPGGGSSKLEFGECSIYETKELPIKMYNTSKLPQKVKFISTGACISVALNEKLDDEGCILLPPLSYVNRTIVFAPNKAGSYKSNLLCLTNWGRKLEISCSGIGVKPNIKFQYSEIKFQPVALGSKLSIDIPLICEKMHSALMTDKRKQVKSIIKSIWDGNKSQQVDDTNNILTDSANGQENEESAEVFFEFGQPKIMGIFTKNGLAEYRSVQLQNDAENIKYIEEQSIVADSATIRANINCKNFNSVKISSKSKSGLKSNISIKNLDVDTLFNSFNIDANQSRVLVPLSLETIQSKQENALIPSFDFEDDISVDILPSKGTLKMGATQTVKVEICPSTIEKLKAHVIIREKLEKAKEQLADEMAVKNDVEEIPPEVAVTPTPTISKKEAAKSAKGAKDKSNNNDKASEKVKEKESASNITSMSRPSFSVTAESLKKTLSSMYEQYSSSNLQSGENKSMVKLSQAEDFDYIDETCISIFIPCFVSTERSGRVIHKSTQNLIDYFAPGGQMKKNRDVIYIHAITPIVKPDLLLIDQDEIDFGLIPVSTELKKSFKIYNPTDQDICLEHLPLPENSPISLARELGVIKSREFKTIFLKFKPTINQQSAHQFSIVTKSTQISVSLKGEGIIPKISISPEDCNVFFGDVLLSDNATQTISITNTNVYPISFEMQLVSCDYGVPGANEIRKRRSGTLNYNKKSAFSVLPCQVRDLEPGATREFTITFNPDRESDLYFDDLFVNLPGSTELHYIKLHGRCWDTTAALYGYDKPVESISEPLLSLNPSFEYDYAQKLWNNEVSGERSSNEKTLKDILGMDDPDIVHQNNGGNNALPTSATVSSTKADGGKKKGAANAAASVTNEDLIGDILRLTTRVKVRYVTVTCPWEKQSDGMWKLVFKDLVIGNLKPASLVKPETKRPPICEYTIEPCNSSFEYIDENYMFVEKNGQINSQDQNTMWQFAIEPSKGSIDLGSSKSIKISVKNPKHEFWTSLQSIQDSMKSKENANAKTPANKGDKTIENAAINKESKSKSEVSAAMISPLSTVLDPIVASSNEQFQRPVYIDTFFKITVKGGYRLVEPKGNPAPSESRVWMVRVVAPMPKHHGARKSTHPASSK